MHRKWCTDLQLPDLIIFVNEWPPSFNKISACISVWNKQRSLNSLPSGPQCFVSTSIDCLSPFTIYMSFLYSLILELTSWSETHLSSDRCSRSRLQHHPLSAVVGAIQNRLIYLIQSFFQDPSVTLSTLIQATTTANRHKCSFKQRVITWQ